MGSPRDRRGLGSRRYKVLRGWGGRGMIHPAHRDEAAMNGAQEIFHPTLAAKTKTRLGWSSRRLSTPMSQNRDMGHPAPGAGWEAARYKMLRGWGTRRMLLGFQLVDYIPLSLLDAGWTTR